MADTNQQAGGDGGGGGGGGFSLPNLSWEEVTKRGDLMLAGGVVGILSVLILPMPTWLLDFSLAISLVFSVLILMTVMFIEKPLQFSSFPTILLIASTSARPSIWRQSEISTCRDAPVQ